MKQELLYEGFLKSVKKNPDKIAVKDGNKTLTYQALFEKSCQIAFILNKLGIQKKYIPILGNKTVESISAILGSLFSENTYVGLDINQPANRLTHIFSLLSTEVLIITDMHPRLENEVKKLKYTPKYILDLSNNCYGSLFNKSELIKFENIYFEPLIYSPESIAYTLFTSGSTGHPKGVCISHRAASAALDMFQSHINLKSSDYIANQAALCFDLSVFDIFGSLNAGATLHLITPEITSVPKLFLKQF